jgi:hypothetical protein
MAEIIAQKEESADLNPDIKSVVPKLHPDFYLRLLDLPSCKTKGVCDNCDNCEH